MHERDAVFPVRQALPVPRFPEESAEEGGGSGQADAAPLQMKVRRKFTYFPCIDL